MSLGIYQPKLAQQYEVIPNSPFCCRLCQFSADFSKRPFISICENLKDFPLPLAEVVADTMGSDIIAWQESYHYLTCTFLELRLWMSRRATQFYDLLSTTSPAFDQTPPIENLGQERIARPRSVFPLEVGYSNAVG